MLPRLLAVAAIAALPAVASATTIVDGGFEAAGTGVSDYCYSNFSGVNPQCAPGSWGNQGGVIRSGSGAWGGTTTPDGNYYGMLQGAQVLTQTVLATNTGSLILNWIDANRTNNGGAHSYFVTVNGLTIGTFTSGFGGFTPQFTNAFGVIAGNSYTIAFNGIAAGDTTTFIDKVSLSAVPEPATWAMMLLGFGMIGAGARSRSRSRSRSAARIVYA